MKFGIEVSQQNKLILTPELRQTINMLQYSSQDLMEFLQEQALENPFLQVKERTSDPFVTKNASINSFKTYNKDTEYDVVNNHSANSHHTLEKHLMEQINLIHGINLTQKRILEFLIGHLNQHGFLEMESIAAAKALSRSFEEINESIAILQSLDPIGVGARDFKDSLLIQMKAQSYDDHIAYTLVDKHLEDIAANRLQKLAKLHRVTVEDVQEAIDYIKTLNPRPCSEFSHEITQYIAPDVIVERVNREYVILVNDHVLPELSVNHLQLHNKQDSDDDFIQKKLQEASILMNGIKQRNYTLYKVAQVILKKQKDFFKYGMNKLKPMTLKDLSEELGYHESTISRATNGKYIQTPHGLYPLKNLFTSGLKNDNGNAAESSVSIKGRIKNLITKENKKSPHSDQQIVTFLMQEGIKISRRTVAKYREEEGIPGSSKRRVY